MAPFEALYGRRYMPPIRWFEVGEAILIELELVCEAMDKVQLIRERLKIFQSRQKSYPNVRKRELEFEVDDWSYLKTPLMKGLIHFDKKWNLSSPYISLYQIWRRYNKVAYELDLPSELTLVHVRFHVLLLKKCVSDPTSIVPLESIGVK
ncbi:uncharacterized protein LOC129870754 [Solanum dulcamara]|uniref:uncharacterized protein LOC129870754 n=1 Tax=Solanum dulcamara TaxID=45834 RepID=UPI002485D9DF|nr:uncharacterized protein LOC129870754 [Solanum dulcamara]